MKEFCIIEARKIENKPSCYDRDCFYSICDDCLIKKELNDIQKRSRDIRQQRISDIKTSDSRKRCVNKKS